METWYLLHLKKPNAAHKSAWIAIFQLHVNLELRPNICLSEQSEENDRCIGGYVNTSTNFSSSDHLALHHIL